MPATAGRVRMPAKNRVHSSLALQTHPIWQSVIGYDPYAPAKDTDPKAANNKGPEAENAYASYQLAVARLKNSTSDEKVPGACKKCGRVGHLTFQCRNLLSVKEEEEPDATELKNVAKDKPVVKSSSEESSSDSSDSEYDSEMERLIAQKFGKKVTSKTKASDEDDSDSDAKKKKKRKKRRRGVAKKRTSRKKDLDDSESDCEEKKGKNKKRRRREEPHGRRRKGKRTEDR